MHASRITEIIRPAQRRSRFNRATAPAAVTSNTSSSQTIPCDTAPIARNFFEAVVFMN
jgi:hypothetical protein